MNADSLSCARMMEADTLTLTPFQHKEGRVWQRPGLLLLKPDPKLEFIKHCALVFSLCCFHMLVEMRSFIKELQFGN